MKGHQPTPADQRSKEAEAYRRWYKTARWQRLRWSVLVRDLFTCQDCKTLEDDTSKLVADHIKPHKGDEQSFWDADNLQCLCSTCHDSAKQSQEKTGKARQWVGLDGYRT